MTTKKDKPFPVDICLSLNEKTYLVLMDNQYFHVIIGKTQNKELRANDQSGNSFFRICDYFTNNAGVEDSRRSINQYRQQI